MADYQEFKSAMDTLEAFIDRTETKEIDGEPHITIDENNVDEFREIIFTLNSVASSEDNYVDEIMEYLTELDQRLTDKNMIAKFITVFAGMHCLATASKLPQPSDDVRVDDWVFEVSNLNAKPWERFGKVTDIIVSEEGAKSIKVKAPVENNEIIEWEEGTFVVIEGMEAMLKKYQEKYTKTF